MSIPYYLKDQQLQPNHIKQTQNLAAMLSYKKSRREDIYICLQELHWATYQV